MNENMQYGGIPPKSSFVTMGVAKAVLFVCIGSVCALFLHFCYKYYLALRTLDTVNRNIDGRGQRINSGPGRRLQDDKKQHVTFASLRQ